MNLDETPTKRDWILPLTLAAISAVMSAYNAYNNNDKVLAQRITVVETQQKNDGARLERIENKIDRIYEIVVGTK